MEGPTVDLVTTYDVKSKHNNLETDKNTPVLSVPSNVPLQKFSDRQNVFVYVDMYFHLIFE